MYYGGHLRYPPEFVDRVIEANSLVNVISQYTQLKPSGQGFMGRCPFPDHVEKTASFSVSDSKQVYHCFGCKKSGNIFTFLKDYNGMSFPEAVEYLADRAGIVLPELSDQQSSGLQIQADKKKSMLRLNKIASDFFAETLKRTAPDSPIRSYIQKRKLTSETIQEFQIGFAPNDWQGLADYLVKKNISLQLAEEAKLVKSRKEATSGYFDLFRDRLIFPILSPNGETLAFGGRIHDQGEPKYLNSPETLVFHKGRVLYGLAQTARYIRAEDCVVIVEGYMDLVSLFQSGLKNVAATMGTALTVDHCRLIKRLTNNVVVLFDSDEAGQRAAERSLPLLLAAGLYPKGLILTEAKDPDEFVTQFGLAALQKKITAAPELFSLVLQMFLKDYKGSATDKVKLVDLVKPIFDAIPDIRLKSLYASELAQKMNTDLSWIRSALSHSGSTGGGSVASVAGRGPEAREKLGGARTVASVATISVSGGEAVVPQALKLSLAGVTQAEQILLQLALKSRANFELLLSQQILSQINHLGVRTLLENATQVYRQEPLKFDRLTSHLIDKVDQPELLFSKEAFTSTEFDAEKENKIILDCCRRIQQLYLKSQAKQMALGLNQMMDTDKLKEIEVLQRSRISLNKNDK